MVAAQLGISMNRPSDDPPTLDVREIDGNLVWAWTRHPTDVAAGFSWRSLAQALMADLAQEKRTQVCVSFGETS